MCLSNKKWVSWPKYILMLHQIFNAYLSGVVGGGVTATSSSSTVLHPLPLPLPSSSLFRARAMASLDIFADGLAIGLLGDILVEKFGWKFLENLVLNTDTENNNKKLIPCSCTCC